jgi:hypothetical protein
METSETFDFGPLLAAALALLRDWLSEAGERAGWRDRNSTGERARNPKLAQDARRLDTRGIETLSGARGAKFRAGKLSSWMFFIAAALAIVLIACALGRGTFQSDSDAWKPLGTTEDSFVGQ